MRITCPNCGRILGDTKDSINANINCRGCKKTVSIKIKFAKTADYLPERINNDKSE